MLRKERPGISRQSSYPEHAVVIEAPLTNAAAIDRLEPKRGGENTTRYI